ncbi:1-acylglycerol-3-phosphate O-acyltransferase [compost metagenome]
MSKVLSALYLFYAALIFIVWMFISLPFVWLATGIFHPPLGKRIGLTFLRIWAWAFSLLSFFWIYTRHKNLINRKQPHIYIGNHGSYLDAVAVCISIPQPFSALGKAEMAKVPVFGWIYKRMVVMIDRSSRESREQSVQVLKEEIRRGQSILLFPEGTMNKGPEALADFYDGAFRIAIETQTPIQPFVMLNNRELLPRTNPLSARPGILTTVFLPAVSMEGYHLTDLDDLKATVFRQMEKALTDPLS